MEQNKELIDNVLIKLKEFDKKSKELFIELTKDMDKEKIDFFTDNWMFDFVIAFESYKDPYGDTIWSIAEFDKKYGEDWLDIGSKFEYDEDELEDHIYNTILPDFFALFNKYDFMIFNEKLISETENVKERILDEITSSFKSYESIKKDKYKEEELKTLIEIALANFDKRSKELFQELTEELDIDLKSQICNTVTAFNFAKNFKLSWNDEPTFDYKNITSESRIMEAFKYYCIEGFIEVLNALVLETANIRENIQSCIDLTLEKYKLQKSA